MNNSIVWDIDSNFLDNLTYLQNVDIPYQPRYEALQILNDICRQFEQNFILVVFFIFTFYITASYILPVVRDYLKNNNKMLDETLEPVLRIYENTIDTFALGGCVYMIVVWWYQSSLTFLYKFWAVALILFALLSGWYRWKNKRKY